MAKVSKVTKSSFKSVVLPSTRPVLIDFYADWCGPCRMLAPILDRLAVEFEGRAEIVKVNVDAEPELASAFEVRSIPTLALMVKGQLVGKTAGLVSEAGLRQILERWTDGAAAQRQVG